MKLLMILVDSNHQDDVERILEAHEVSGYSELPNVLGKGESGRKLGSRAFPGSSTLYFTAIPRDMCETLCGDLKALREKAGREEGLKVFTLDAEMIL
jgi:hypothetical protein